MFDPLDEDKIKENMTLDVSLKVLEFLKRYIFDKTKIMSPYHYHIERTYCFQCGTRRPRHSFLSAFYLLKKK